MINIHGIFSEANGWTRHANGFANALAQQAPISIQDWGQSKNQTHLSEKIARFISESTLSEHAEYGIAIGPLERMNDIIGKKKIASIIWETSLIPECKLRFLKNKDQIWIPSRWGKELLVQNGIPKELIKIVPEGVDASLFRPLEISQENNDKIFQFLCIGKWEVRKGIQDLIKVYCTAFSRNEPVELLLHTLNPYIAGFSNNEIAENICRDYPQHPKITFLNLMSDEKLVQVYSLANAFVLPTKAEGWGLPIIEAMSCEIPVIVTNYSGLTEFVNTESGYFIEVEKMIPVSDPAFYNPNDDYGLWAQPDLEHMAYLMRHVFTHRDEAKLKGKNARKEIINKWTWDHAARKGMEALGI